ncbi:hypothetical protein CYMTET_41785 [Cymbomonas tetramitiformis]|uniref:FHA domain-containing protein n=1 Tax=Cymbomonas tetramitiformis TaxID=36881 RepID=A0AAE0C5D3_9CHLO|nr:hypothetical protein CYMTET_41785 [Cymbomonas tetramitiformis]
MSAATSLKQQASSQISRVSGHGGQQGSSHSTAQPSESESSVCYHLELCDECTAAKVLSRSALAKVKSIVTSVHDPSLSIGRALDATVSFGDSLFAVKTRETDEVSINKRVSKLHCKIERRGVGTNRIASNNEEAEYVLVDYSTFGTFVGGEQVRQEVKLCDKDVIVILPSMNDADDPDLAFRFMVEKLSVEPDDDETIQLSAPRREMNTHEMYIQQEQQIAVLRQELETEKNKRHQLEQEADSSIRSAPCQEDDLGGMLDSLSLAGRGGHLADVTNVESCGSSASASAAEGELRSDKISFKLGKAKAKVTKSKPLKSVDPPTEKNMPAVDSSVREECKGAKPIEVVEHPESGQAARQASEGSLCRFSPQCLRFVIADTSIFLNPAEYDALKQAMRDGSSESARQSEQCGVVVVLVLAMDVVRELDGLKNRNDQVGFGARQVLRWLHQLLAEQSPFIRLQTPEERMPSEYVTWGLANGTPANQAYPTGSGDDAILSCALYFAHHVSPGKTAFLSGDRAQVIKAKLLGLHPADTAQGFLRGWKLLQKSVAQDNGLQALKQAQWRSA